MTPGLGARHNATGKKLYDRCDVTNTKKIRNRRLIYPLLPIPQVPTN